MPYNNTRTILSQSNSSFILFLKFLHFHILSKTARGLVEATLSWWELLDVLVALLSNASRKSEIANQTGFISVYLQSDSASLLLQIRSHLIKLHDSLSRCHQRSGDVWRKVHSPLNHFSNSPIKDLRLLMLIVPENKREICENKQYNSMDVQYSILTRWQYQIESTDC